MASIAEKMVSNKFKFSSIFGRHLKASLATSTIQIANGFSINIWTILYVESLDDLSRASHK